MLTQGWRAVAVYRLIALGYPAVFVILHHRDYAHPNGGYLALAFMAVWSVVVTLAYARYKTRRWWTLAADLTVAVGLILSTRLVDTAARIAAGAATLPSVWAASAVLACAVVGGPWTGLGASAVIAAADAIERGGWTLSTTYSIVLLASAGLVGGYAARLGQRGEAAIERASRVEAASAERERLGRELHDSVLQTLALISARGRDLGGEAAELGRLAASQEAALRALITTPPEPAPAGHLDLAAALAPLASERVTVSLPARAVLLPEPAARAVAAATQAALDNVAQHAGTGAKAWILVDDEGERVTVSVRDDGAGFPPGRLDRAAADGRLGVRVSIVGRLRDAGGDARVTSAPGQGTEVELHVRRR